MEFAISSLILVALALPAAQGIRGAEAEEPPVVGCPDIADPPDRSVTGADLSVVAQYVGLAVTTEAQLWADLSIDNNITGADLSVVAAKIGGTCFASHGRLGEGSDANLTAHIGQHFWGCRWWTWGYYTHQPDDPQPGYLVVDDWGGVTYCEREPLGPYVTRCTFFWDALNKDTGQWELVAVTQTVQVNGAYCTARGWAAWIPCSTIIIGSIYHDIRNYPTGPAIHGPHWHSEAEEGGFGFAACGFMPGAPQQVPPPPHREA